MKKGTVVNKMPVINSGLVNVSPGESIEFFQSFMQGLLLTHKDKLEIRSEELKPKIIEYLKNNPRTHFSDLMMVIDANLVEIRFAVNQLKKEGIILSRKD